MDFRTSPVFVSMCKDQLRQMLAAATGIDSAVIVSGDGFEVAAQLQGDHSASRIAAMTSSLSALAHAASNEMSIGSHRSLMVESESGTLLVVRVPTAQAELLLSLVTRSSSVMGAVLYAARGCASSIAQRMSGYA